MNETIIEVFKIELQKYKDLYYDVLAKLADSTIKSLKEMRELSSQRHAYSKIIEAIEELIKQFIYP